MATGPSGVARIDLAGCRIASAAGRTLRHLLSGQLEAVPTLKTPFICCL